MKISNGKVTNNRILRQGGMSDIICNIMYNKGLLWIATKCIGWINT